MVDITKFQILRVFLKAFRLAECRGFESFDLPFPEKRRKMWELNIGFVKNEIILIVLVARILGNVNGFFMICARFKER